MATAVLIMADIINTEMTLLTASEETVSTALSESGVPMYRRIVRWLGKPTRFLSRTSHGSPSGVGRPNWDSRGTKNDEPRNTSKSEAAYAA